MMKRLSKSTLFYFLSCTALTLPVVMFAVNNNQKSATVQPQIESILTHDLPEVYEKEIKKEEAVKAIEEKGEEIVAPIVETPVVAEEIEPEVAPVELPEKMETQAAPEVAEVPVEVEKPVEEIKVPAVTENKSIFNQILINGRTINFENGGQSRGQAIIDANRSMVSTWGGSQVHSNDDGLSTHFIGHNPGIFSTLFGLQNGHEISVTDGSGASRIYKVTNIVEVNDNAVSDDGTDYWNQITGADGGERIVLQTCINDVRNLIVFAQ